MSSIAVALLLLGGRWLSGTASAQWVVQAPSPEQRAKQFADLAEDVEPLERQAMALRKVVQFVKPTVVHIDAKRTDTFNTRGRPASSVEDAGSGTILEDEGKH